MAGTAGPAGTQATAGDPAALLTAVLSKTTAIITGVRPDDSRAPTPCPDLDVDGLVDHLTGWAQSFADRLGGTEPSTDPGTYHAGADPAAEFAASAREMQAAYHERRPGAAALPVGLLLMEFLGHGWDLARATGQPSPFSDEEADAALTAGRQLLQPGFRGPGKAFGPEVTPPTDATAVDRLIAFLGRDPRWQPPTPRAAESGPGEPSPD